eukprot:CAMPEP_0118969584 /NCGR_PEP_ID=MMETSP1173-20130426/6654_1 /TAXON_ID=1034831 /ORGANISM="Rhizochromulina marina cf, Strain CCMP1243" /LENGTH=47 /DNA_ID= /DNA_START= /DNA_END= /DNA_ORIENTATION=
MAGCSPWTTQDTRQRLRTLVRLSAVGFFVNCQPSEPYLSKYLVQDKG